MDIDAAAQQRRIEMILERVDALPTLSPVALQLLTIGSVDDVDVDEVVRLLESDPALTAMVLGLCRRAGRGLGDRVRTVKQAVVLLGFEAVRSAVLGVHVYELVQEQGEELDAGVLPDSSGGKFDRVGMWKHSIATACAGELIARSFPKIGVRPEHAFVAGLLHDLGKLVLELVLPKAAARAAELAERRGTDFGPTARAIIGVDHHTAGRRLAARWELPYAIADAMWLYGQPGASLPDLPHKQLILVVTLANALVRRHHLGWSADFGEPRTIASCAEDLGISPEQTMSLLPLITTEMAERCNILKLENTSEPQILLKALANANRRLSILNRNQSAKVETSRAQSDVLAGITRFSARWSPRQSVVETLEQIAQSVSEVLGPGFFAAVYEAADGEPWNVYQFSRSGRLEHSTATEAPPGARLRGESLSALASPSGLSVAAMGVLPWLSDYLAGAPDLRRVKLMPICVGGERGGPSAILLYDIEPTELSASPDDLDALRAAWGGALQASSNAERARRMGESLAEALRMLAETQAKLSERESMARLGEMSAGAAHEMNNPLTVIRGRSQLLKDRLTDDLSVAALGAISEATDHLTDLISGLHELAATPHPSIERVSVADLIVQAVDRVDHVVQSPVDTMVDVADGILIDTDRELAVSALCEVLTNAQDASDGTPIEVSAQVGEGESRLVIVVRDRGAGISERAMRHGFDPFFSEKPAGRKRGLGLCRARRATLALSGEILMDRPPEGGTRVTITLPGVAQAGMARAA